MWLICMFVCLHSLSARRHGEQRIPMPKITVALVFLRFSSGEACFPSEILSLNVLNVL